ncbi:S1C family serine protease [Aneurinibacillus terranovensis]|uniref:S1C family serine protease n=1 Tax=Aneurinibacillus terranovensis TaxID=278991 RepID=UPI000405CAF8|nr:trypsin-like peptidase domain-containing protein [Aneurinibacillus terranovensis]
MGYYDDDFDSQRKKRGGGTSTFLTALIGAIIGGLIVLMLVPTMIKSGYLSGVQNALPGNQALPNENTNTPNVPGAHYNVDVNSGVVNAVSKVENAVVGVINMQSSSDFWGQNTGNVEKGVGSGIVFRKVNGKAYIVTNNHVIEGANQVEVSLSNGQPRVKARVVGFDPLTDLAVLEIDSSKVTQIAEFGDSSKLKVGEPAIAIGNPLGMEFSRSVTEGIISSTERTMPVDLNGDGQTDYEVNVLQTDAAINPGNSGGALINIAGQVIGINSMKISETGVEGLGFAIPIDDASRIIDDLIRYHSVQRPYMGISPVDLQEISPDEWTSTLKLPSGVQSGVVIKDTTQFGPAEKAGLKQYDVIVKLDNQPIQNSAELRKYLYTKRAGDTIQVTFYRGAQEKTVSVVLAKEPRNVNK